eukprot:SAG31_NODE_1930_length_6881_cov_6.976998_8_plen_64_part_00
MDQAKLIAQVSVSGAEDASQKIVGDYCENAYFLKGGRLMHNTLQCVLPRISCGSLSLDANSLP